MKIIKRDGRAEDFDRRRIEVAMDKALRACGTTPDRTELCRLADTVIAYINKQNADQIALERIQDYAERTLAEAGYFQAARAYILYREEHRKARESRLEEALAAGTKLTVQKKSGKKEAFNPEKLLECLERAATGYSRDIDLQLVYRDIVRNIYDGIPSLQIEKAAIQSLSSFAELDPVYEQAAARILLQSMYREVTGVSNRDHLEQHELRVVFRNEIKAAVARDHFNPGLSCFNLDELADALDFSRDMLLGFRGLQTLNERYFYRHNGEIRETPQAFWMRAAMGLAVNEKDKEAKAIEFYTVMSKLFFIPSTPTLFHSGLKHSQLSSCYLSTVPDDLDMIFKVIGDNARLSKWSGGIGNDWTPVRATGSLIKSTRVDSQGVIPFLKIANDTTVAINRSGKRRGATCAYLETWHLDIEDFLDLRRNTGDERRRTHDMNTANWVPDLFMQRVREGGSWTLFSPSDTPDLHDLYGRAFKERYEYYEEQTRTGTIKRFKILEAGKLWRKMLTRLFETGHPWITFKDPCNIRSPQDHVGVVHNSNLCTEITLNNSAEETAVCNLGSVNLSKMVLPNGILSDRLRDTIRTAMRMLDNVIDLNYYPTVEAEKSNKKHRPVGLGMMGFQDALFIIRTAFSSSEAAEFTDRLTEMFSWYALEASADLAQERGSYLSFPGSKWDRGILPADSLDLLEDERGEETGIDKSGSLDWEFIREKISRQGLRNSNCMALAPTATISNIAGCFPSIEPVYKNIYVKSNMSGEFTVLNSYLANDLKEAGFWDRKMIDDLKYYDGNLARMARIPAAIKQLYSEAFDIDPLQLIEMTARRAKWIDQSQSHNVFMKGTSGKQLESIYMTAWEKGLKSTYYLRTLAASQIEKSTLKASEYGFTQKRTYDKPATQVGSVCSLTDPDCEACQ